MATLSITTNLAHVMGQVSEKLKRISNVEFLLKPATEKAIALIHPRIHVQGKASDGGQIGEYSKGYLAVRSGVFQNTQRITRGVNKGKPKKGTAGVFTVGNKVGASRPVFNRGTDPKVIISLTREMESDYITIPLPEEQAYGVGFSNEHNYDKSQFVEHTYNKPIFSLTSEEESAVFEFIENLVNQELQK